jgi:hypothetical protein
MEKRHYVVDGLLAQLCLGRAGSRSTALAAPETALDLPDYWKDVAARLIATTDADRADTEPE